jgi:hypothetical protein
MRAGNKPPGSSAPDSKTRQPQIQKYGQKRLLLRYRQIIFWLFQKAIFPRNYVPFRFELRNGLFRGIRNSIGMNTFFRGITESFPRLFCGICSEQNSVANPSLHTPKRDHRHGGEEGAPYFIDVEIFGLSSLRHSLSTVA